MYTVDDVINRNPIKWNGGRLKAPRYNPPIELISSQELYRGRVALAVEQMARHMTDEGWQLMLGLEARGYLLAGHKCTVNSTDVVGILEETKPHTVVVQDKREWDYLEGGFREKEYQFHNVEVLKDRDDLFKLTILKDSQQRPKYHLKSAEEMGVNAWIVYYHPRIVAHLAPYTRPEHLIRTYHTVRPERVPTYSPLRLDKALLSGATGSVYPVRTTLVNKKKRNPNSLKCIEYLPHPGYHAKGTDTDNYLKTLSRYKVAICTASIYGYALRKLIEATACGCRVITDLPSDEILPGIDENLVRITPTTSLETIVGIVEQEIKSYDPDRQERLAERAKDTYDYRRVGAKLVSDIEALRRSYNNVPSLSSVV